VNRFAEKAANVIEMLRRGEFRALANDVTCYLYSDEYSLGLRRDLDKPFTSPPAKIPLTIRPLRDTDVDALLGPPDIDLPWDAFRLRQRRRRFLEQDIPTCYVAVTENDEPAYMQWLIGAESNDRIQAYFEGKFPRLQQNEALLELAFSPEAFRGLRIMPYAMSEIALRAREFGARYVVTFVQEDNLPSLKGSERAGFLPYQRRHERWRWIRGQKSFRDLPPGTDYPHNRPANDPETNSGDATVKVK